MVREKGKKSEMDRISEHSHGRTKGDHHLRKSILHCVSEGHLMTKCGQRMDAERDSASKHRVRKARDVNQWKLSEVQKPQKDLSQSSL